MTNVYKITLKTPSGTHEILCPDDQYILDAAEENDDSPYGKGKWVLINADYHKLHNAAVILVQRIATLEGGKAPDDRVLWHTVRTLTFEWQRFDSNDLWRSLSEEHIYGETRIIEQKYLPELLPNGNFRMRWVPDVNFPYASP